MHLLTLSLTLPFPATNGHKIRNWGMLQALAAEGHEISLLTFAEPKEMRLDMAELLEVCRDVRVVPLILPSLTKARDIGGLSRALLSHDPYGVRRFRSGSMRCLISTQLGTKHFDAIFCETSYVLVNLPTVLGTPVVLDNHNVEHLLLRRYAARTRNVFKRAYIALESRKFERWERAACGRAAMVLACSEYDRKRILEICPDRAVAVAPNVVDVETYSPIAHGDGRTLLYIGGMDWFPNRDAVEFFTFNILPLVRRLLPDADLKFIVAGRNPAETFRRKFAAVPGVTFTGTVSDMREEIAKADVCVVPLRIGSGTRLKILEAAAMGKAIVSTRLGAEGLDFTEGAEIRLADDPSGFARAVADLLSEPSARQSFGSAARRRVERQYSLTALRQTLREALAPLEGSLEKRGSPQATTGAAR